MAPNFLDLATTLENLGARWLLEKKVNFVPWKFCLLWKKCSSRTCTFAKDRGLQIQKCNVPKWRHSFNVKQAVFDVVCFCICASTQQHLASAVTLKHQTTIFKADGRIIQSQMNFGRKKFLQGFSIRVAKNEVWLVKMLTLVFNLTRAVRIHVIRVLHVWKWRPCTFKITI